MKRKSNEEFLSEVKEVNPNIKVLEEYKNDSTKIEVQCIICNHKWKTRPNTLIRGHGCPYCANNIRKTTDQFIKEMKEYNLYIEVIGEYKTALTPIKVKCKICGNEWEAKPNRLLQGAQCMNCIKPHTSFMEQFMLYSFKEILGDNNVKSRDTSAIDLELDIYIPSYKLAIEPGTWLYHEKKSNNLDLKKRKLCINKGIRLITIYDTYPAKKAKPFDENCYVYEGFLNEYKYPRLIKLINEICESIGIKDINLNWNNIANKAYEACHFNANENFVDELKKFAPNIEVLEDYKGSNIPILVRNKKCNHPAWKARPYTLLKGNGCPVCGRKVASNNRTKTEKEFIDQLNKINPSIKVLGHYIKASERVLVKCLECGNEWNPKAYSLLQGRGCPKCRTYRSIKNNKGKTHKKTTEEFIQEMKKIDDTIEIIGNYVNTHKKIECRCKVCGYEWSAVPGSLLRGVGHKRAKYIHKNIK